MQSFTPFLVHADVLARHWELRFASSTALISQPSAMHKLDHMFYGYNL